MIKDLFDTQNLSIQEFVVQPEIFSTEVKSKKYLVEEDPCDGFFETIMGRLMKIESSDNPNLEDIFYELPECKLVFKSLNILGEYYPSEKQIKYYRQTPQTLEIVKIHERFHAIHHLMPDAKGQIWDDFPTIEPFYKELLAQLFTFIYIRDFEPSLMYDFDNLNQNQPFIYRTFKIFSHYDHVKAERLYWTIRQNRASDLLMKLLKKIVSHINLTTTNKFKMMAPSTYVFKRNISKSLINKLLAEPLYQNHLKADIFNGIVFPAIREGRIDFYHKGGKLFAYEEQGGFHTHIKYAAVLDNLKNDYLTETELKNCTISDFSSNYKRIKENCSMYSGVEASGVSNIYEKYSYLVKSGHVVLDIEISFKSNNQSKSQDRIDLLIFDTKSGKLKFVEAKHYSNSEIWSATVPKVIGQISRYENQIKAKKQNILVAYNNYLKDVELLFGIKLPPIIDIENHVTLLIFGFDSHQRSAKLKVPGFKSQYQNVVVYEKGNVKDIVIQNIRDNK